MEPIQNKKKSGQKKSGQKNPVIDLDGFAQFINSTETDDGNLNFRHLINLAQTVESIIHGLGNLPRNAYAMDQMKETITLVEHLKNPNLHTFRSGGSSVSIVASNLQTTNELMSATDSWSDILGVRRDLRIKFEILDCIVNKPEGCDEPYFNIDEIITDMLYFEINTMNDVKPEITYENIHSWLVSTGIQITNSLTPQVNLNDLIGLVPKLLSKFGLPQIPITLMYKLLYFSRIGPQVTRMPDITFIKWFAICYKGDFITFLKHANVFNVEPPHTYDHQPTDDELSIKSARTFCDNFKTQHLNALEDQYISEVGFATVDLNKYVTGFFKDVEFEKVTFEYVLFQEDLERGLNNIDEIYRETLQYVDETRDAATENTMKIGSRENIQQLNYLLLRHEMQQKKDMKLVFLKLSSNFLMYSGRDGISRLCKHLSINIDTMPSHTIEHLIDCCMMFTEQSILRNCKGNIDYAKFMCQPPYCEQSTYGHTRPVYVHAEYVTREHVTHKRVFEGPITYDVADGPVCLINLDVRQINDNVLLFHINCILKKWIKQAEDILEYRQIPTVPLYEKITNILATQYDVAAEGVEYAKQFGNSAMGTAKQFGNSAYENAKGVVGAVGNWSRPHSRSIFTFTDKNPSDTNRPYGDEGVQSPITAGGMNIGDVQTQIPVGRSNQSDLPFGEGRPHNAPRGGGGSNINNAPTGSGSNDPYVDDPFLSSLKNPNASYAGGPPKQKITNKNNTQLVYNTQQMRFPKVSSDMLKGLFMKVDFSIPPTEKTGGRSATPSVGPWSKKESLASTPASSLAPSRAPSRAPSPTNKGGSKTRKFRRKPRKLMSRRKKYSRRK